MNPRRAALVGLVFVVIAIAYAGLAYVVPGGYNVDWAGTTMLIALGAAMSIMAYVLSAGARS